MLCAIAGDGLSGSFECAFLTVTAGKTEMRGQPENLNLCGKDAYTYY